MRIKRKRKVIQIVLKSISLKKSGKNIKSKSFARSEDKIGIIIVMDNISKNAIKKIKNKSKKRDVLVLKFKLLKIFKEFLNIVIYLYL